MLGPTAQICSQNSQDPLFLRRIGQLTPYIFGHLRLGRIDPVTKVTKPVWGRTRVPTCVSRFPAETG